MSGAGAELRWIVSIASSPSELASSTVRAGDAVAERVAREAEKHDVEHDDELDQHDEQPGPRQSAEQEPEGGGQPDDEHRAGSHLALVNRLVMG